MQGDKMNKIDELKAKKAKIEKMMAQIKVQQNRSERTADNHLKICLGGAVLNQLEKMPHTVAASILIGAEGGMQKQGLAREKFEALKTKFNL
jgi:Spy/CpxP family protein refolding chaperone